MAYNKQKLQTLKCLRNDISKIPRSFKSSYNSHEGIIFARFGRLYATNNYILASVDYDEERNAGEYEWQQVKRFTDDNGRLLEQIEYEPSIRQFRNRIFEDMFIEPMSLHYEPCATFNALLVEKAMKLFRINDLAPTFSFRDEKLELAAHNREVSIRCLVMGRKI